jgi:hypothetical protein
MIVAMVAVRVVQTSINQIVDMIPMRHRLVTAARPVLMRVVMPSGALPRRAAVRILFTYLDNVIVDVVLLLVNEVTVLEVVDVAMMPNRGMATTWPMNMRVILMNGLSHVLLLPNLQPKRTFRGP